MRADAVGLFWSEQPKERAAKARNTAAGWGPMPPVPDNGWRPPEFPNLSGAKIIGFDTETFDPELTEAGPGWGRGKGHIIGASLSVEDGSSWYFPIRHGIDEHGVQRLPPEHAAMNMDPDQVLRYLDHVLHDNRPKAGANLVYDVGWLNWEGVRVGGPLFDIQYAEALLDSETPGVDLDRLALKYLQVGKTTDYLYEWLSQWNRKTPNDRQRKWLYKVPPMLAGPYGEADAALPIQILTKQWAAMHERGVLEVYDMECRLIPLLVAMRMKGAPVNLQTAERVYDDFGVRLEQINHRLNDLVGHDVNPNAPDSVAKAFTTVGIKHPEKKHKKTGEMVVTFDKARLEEVDHPVAATILEWRGLAKVRNTFMKSYIMDKHVNSRVYCSFHPLRGKDGGARSGRFASSDPNLQNIPTRTEEGQLVREAFDGRVFGGRWRAYDYSSIEYRLLAHFAVGRGAQEVRAIFAKDPKADYHAIVGELIRTLTGLDLPRGKVKTINFGIIYGMALNALATALHIPKDEAAKLMEDYHAAAPYARATMDECANEVHRTGMVRTIMNRASDFNAWGSKEWQAAGREALSYEAACRKYGMFNIERQHTHKALNRKLQGSAADVMKKAMVDCWESGLFHDSACGVPILTVHDELDFEDLGDLDNPAWDHMQRTMESTLSERLSVPLLVDGGYGDTWKDCK